MITGASAGSLPLNNYSFDRVLGSQDGGPQIRIPLEEVLSGAEIGQYQITWWSGDLFLDTIIFQWDGEKITIKSYQPRSAIRSVPNGIHIYHGHGVTEMAFSPDGRQLATFACDPDLSDQQCIGEIKLWDVATGNSLDMVINTQGALSHLAWSLDGSRLIGTICLEKDAVPLVYNSVDVLTWDVKTGETINAANLGPINAKLYVSQLTAGGDILAIPSCSNPIDSECYSAEIQVWAIPSQNLIQSFTGFTTWISRVAFSQDGKLLAASPGTGIWIGDIATGGVTSVLEEFVDASLPLVWSPDSILTAATCEGPDSFDCQSIKIWFWDQPTDRLLDSFHTRLIWIDDMAWSPDGSLLAIAGCLEYDININCTNSRMYFWSLQSRKIVGEYNVVLWQISFSPNGDKIAFIDGTSLETVIVNVNDLINLP